MHVNKKCTTAVFEGCNQGKLSSLAVMLEEQKSIQWLSSLKVDLTNPITLLGGT